MLYRRGRVYWVQWEHAGRRYRYSTGREHLREAEREARRIRHEIESAAGPGGRQTGTPLVALAELDVERAKRERLGPRREGTLDGIWSPLLRILGHHTRAEDLSLSSVLDYQARRAAEVRGQTIRREVQALRRGILEARRRGIMRVDPIDWALLPQIRSDPPCPARRGKDWSAEEIDRVLDHLSAKAITAGHRDRLRLIQLTGLRVEELHRLRPEWVVLTPDDPWPARIDLPPEGAKWGRPRTIALSAPALEIVQRHATAERPTVFERRRPNKSLALASRAAGFARVLTPRDLRRWYLQAVERIGGAVAAQWLGGHSSIATTGLYLAADQRRALAAAAKVATVVDTAQDNSARP